jgi:hypothetical protein
MYIIVCRSCSLWTVHDDGFSVCKYYLGANLQKLMYNLLCAVVWDGILRNSVYSPILVVMFAGSLNWMLIILMYCIFVYFTKRFYLSYISFLLCWSPTSTNHLHSVGHAMIQTVKHWPTTSWATVWSQAGLCGICGGRNGTGLGFSLTLILFFYCHSTNAPCYTHVSLIYHCYYRFFAVGSVLK